MARITYYFQIFPSQASDASLIATAKKSKTNSEGAYQKVHSCSSNISASVATGNYKAPRDDDDDDEWATLEIRDSGGDIGDPRSAFDPLPSAASSKDLDSSPASFSVATATLRRRYAASGRLAEIPATASSATAGCGAFLRRIGFPGAGSPALSAKAATTRDFLICLAAAPFEDDDPLHPRILKTLYYHLRPRDFSTFSSIKRFGKHWEDIGFQGVDPSTDLRGVGMLGLVCLLNWFVDAESSQSAKRVYQLSLDPVQNFPFSATSINVTRLCLQELKRENLNREIHKTERYSSKAGRGTDDACLNAFMLFYRSLFYRLFVEWRDGKKTIADSGFVLKALEKDWAKNPTKCIEEFKWKKGEKGKPDFCSSAAATKDKKKIPSTKKRTGGKHSTDDAVQTFTNLSDL